MTLIQDIKNTLNNISDAVRGSYVVKDKNGVSYREIYEKEVPLVGKRGMIEDKKNLARDMNRAIRSYGQKKE